MRCVYVSLYVCLCMFLHYVYGTERVGAESDPSTF